MKKKTKTKKTDDDNSLVKKNKPFISFCSFSIFRSYKWIFRAVNQHRINTTISSIRCSRDCVGVCVYVSFVFVFFFVLGFNSYFAILWCSGLFSTVYASMSNANSVASFRIPQDARQTISWIIQGPILWSEHWGDFTSIFSDGMRFRGKTVF